MGADQRQSVRSTAASAPSRARTSPLRRGELVQVRSRAEIAATLDADGTRGGLPFMPEMLAFCGQTLRVARRADKVFHDHHLYVGRLHDTVLLESARCDGSAHDGCRMGCQLLWSEAWLRRADVSPNGAEPADDAPPTSLELPVLQADRYVCQATQLESISTPLPWWDVRQYARDLRFRDAPLDRWAGMIGLLATNKLRRAVGLSAVGSVRGTSESAPDTQRVAMQPGDRVRVRSLDAIRTTLDERGRHRGLRFQPEMRNFCGQELQVAHRVDRLIVEWTGQLRRLTDTVALEDVTCQGIAFRNCPRNCYHLWREAWLELIDSK